MRILSTSRSSSYTLLNLSKYTVILIKLLIILSYCSRLTLFLFFSNRRSLTQMKRQPSVSKSKMLSVTLVSISKAYYKRLLRSTKVERFRTLYQFKKICI